MKNKISAISEKLFPSLMDFCKKIIQTPSLSGQEASVAKLVSEEMQKLGYDEVFTDEWGNVIGIVKGSEAGPTIMYNGHMDTVPIGDRSSWGAYDPYGAEIDQSIMQNPLTGNDEKAEVIHGRGSGDLKCNLASQIYAGAILIELRRQGINFAGNFLLTAVVLEENGEMMGTIKLCEETLPNNKIDVDAMVCCEPSSLRIMLGHRGRMEIRVTISGRSCHGSSPWLGINAVEKSAKFIVAVQNMFENKTLEDPFLGKSGIALTMYHCEPNELCIVPDKCTIIYDRRLIPSETTESAIAEIQEVINTLAKGDPDFNATVEINKNQRTAYTGKSDIIESSKEVWIIDQSHPFVKACADSLAELNEPVIFGHWSFSTDTPQLGTRMHKPVIGYGPGQEYLIHTPNEKVRLDFIKRSLPAYALMYLNASRLPVDAFEA